MGVGNRSICSPLPNSLFPLPKESTKTSQQTIHHEQTLFQTIVTGSNSTGICCIGSCRGTTSPSVQQPHGPATRYACGNMGMGRQRRVHPNSICRPKNQNKSRCKRMLVGPVTSSSCRRPIYSRSQRQNKHHYPGRYSDGRCMGMLRTIQHGMASRSGKQC